MRLDFMKMHGLGNDFMVVDLLTQELTIDPEQVRKWSDRHTGIGFDQLLVVAPPTDPAADFRYRIFNADGTEAEQCGNGARCFARFVQLKQLSNKEELVLQTSTGPIRTRLTSGSTVEVDMATPRLRADEVPIVASGLTDSGGALPAPEPPDYDVVADGETHHLTALSMGNPHAVLFVENISSAPVADVGARLASHPAFPEGVNVGFCQIVDRTFARVRVFERGVGETRACGSGACAAVVAGILHDALDRRAKVSLPGGKLRIDWQGECAPVRMAGPATVVFEGHVIA